MGRPLTGLRLEVARAIAPAVRDAVSLIWRTRAEALRSDPIALDTDAATPDAFVVVPILGDGELLGLLYVDGLQTDPSVPVSRLTPLVRLATALSRALPSPSAPLDDAGALVAQTEKQRMLDLLEANEWNIARVARLLDVTRRTIYLRMRRWGIERRKIPKSRP